MASVFLSYDRDDSGRARQFAGALEKAGHDVWWDLHVRGGAQFSKVIEEALKAADVVVLWSANAIESPWVRDEAAVGRDSGRLVPVTLDGTEAPLGFRQFQTIDFSGWNGRGRIAALPQLLDGIERVAARPTEEQPRPAPARARPTRVSTARRQWILAMAALALIAAAGAAAWLWLRAAGLPIVEVASSDASAKSQAAAGDLFVKLGSLAQLGEGKWQLVDSASAPSKPDLIFRTADTSFPNQPRASLVLLDGKDDASLWSREFSYPAGAEADLRLQLSLTAGRVLGCALESREAGGLRRDLEKLFLNGCAALAEAAGDDPDEVSNSLRAVVDSAPRIAPAWSRLLLTDVGLVDVAVWQPARAHAAIATLRADMAKARAVAADLPELTIAQTRLTPPTDYADRISLVEKAVAAAPSKSELYNSKAEELARVGRVQESIEAAERASALDPLSPMTDIQFVMTLAYGGQVDRARTELARVQRTWSGTGALREALWGFNMRFGDPVKAMKYASAGVAGGPLLYLNARKDPSPAAVATLVKYIRRYRTMTDPGAFAFAAQALGFNQNDEFFAYADGVPRTNAALESYVLFRPGLKGIRRDPRFMPFAKRIGLVDYWSSSGHWPDFCGEDGGLPYNCKTEAAKLAGARG